MKLEFQPISSIADSYEWLPFVEVLALFNGSCAIDDLEWDEDSLLHSLLEDTVDVSLRADYEAEPTTGIQVAKDSFISDLRERIADQQTLVGSSYPFFLKNDGNIFLEVKPFENISEAAISYVWLSLFAVISSPSDYLIISPNDRDGFIRDFSKVFEYICCLVMASRSPAFIKYFGDSRDVREFLHRLGDVVYKVGTGTVKQFNQLQPNQTGTNDGGVDIFAIPTLQGAIPQNGTAYLVGVTIQKTDRKNKIVGHDEINRFRDFFLAGPMLAYHGILAIPFDATAIDAANCRDRNCGYITKNEIFRFLADYPIASPRLHDIRSPRRKMRKKSRDLQAVATLVSKGSDLTIAWA